jgi:hypothetical protein
MSNAQLIAWWGGRALLWELRLKKSEPSHPSSWAQGVVMGIEGKPLWTRAGHRDKGGLGVGF